MTAEANLKLDPKLMPDEVIVDEVGGLEFYAEYHVRTEKDNVGLAGWWTNKADGILRLTSFRLIASWKTGDGNQSVRHYSCPSIIGSFEDPPCQAIEYSMFGKPKPLPKLTDHVATILLPGGLSLRITLPYPESFSDGQHQDFLMKSERVSALLALMLRILGKASEDSAALVAAAETEAIARRRRQD